MRVAALYDFMSAADLIRVTQYPQAQESANGILHPPTESDTLKLFHQHELK
jgi:hypothetical protein